jgi:adenylate kinase
VVNVLLFGPPGCGKGTQSACLAEKLRIPAISTGEMFRAECSAGTDLGRRATAILAQGGLVGDDIVNQMVAERIARLDCRNGFLLDGYPRTVQQAKYLSGLLQERQLPPPIVIHLAVPDAVVIERLTSRRQCRLCHRIYNLLWQPPRISGKCDVCGESLITREDDRKEVIVRRLLAYRESTGPVLDWFGARTVQTVDGAAPPDEVLRAVEQIVVDAALTAGVR